MKYIKLCIYVIILFSCKNLYPQENKNFYFRKIQVDEGLSENTVYCILQDSKGFLWFGTKDGLNRYDGNDFRIFRHKVNEPKSLGNNFIRSIAESKTNNLYIGTDVGLYIMNNIDETFELLNIKTSTGEQISTAVNSVLVDKHGMLWLGTMHQGVFVYNHDTNTLQNVKISQNDLGTNAVWSIYEDKSGIIWVGTRLGLLRYNTNIQQLEAVSNLFAVENNSNNEILSILEDTKGNLWLGTWSEGIRAYNKHTGDYTSHLNNSFKNNYITHVRSLFQYDDSSLLVGSDDGLYLFNIDNHSTQRIDIPNFSHSMSDQNIYSIAQDKEAGIWIGTYFGGINYLNTSLSFTESYSTNVMPHSLSGKAVSQFCEDKTGNLWIATEDGGVNYFDVKTKKFTQPIKTSYHNTHALLLDGDNLWIGTFSRGIDIYNTKTKSIINLKNNVENKNTLNDDCVFSIYKTKQGDIYVGTPIGLDKYNKATHDFSHIEDISGFIYDMKEDDYGNLWVATYGNGVVKLNNKTGKCTRYDKMLDKSNLIVQSKLTSVYIDSQKRVWFSSEGRGIFLYDYKTDNFTNISEIDGLPNNVVYGILDDQLGNLWISSNKGLVSFDPSNRTNFNMYGKEDGLQSNQFNYKSSFKAKDGKFYFGGINGFNSFYPQDLSKNNSQTPPPIEITQVRLLGKSSEKEEKEIQTALNERSVIKLAHNQSSFTISYISLSYISQTNNQYAYMLEGVDKDWVYVNNNKSVTYVNLAPGKYRFRVKASNKNGIWNNDGTEIEIIILPPFWLSIPAKIFYALLIGFAAYLLIQFYLRRSKLRQKQHLETFKNEQETLAFKSKIDFFTTIAHEIRTPLSLIKAPLEEILITDNSEKETKQNLLIIEKNCDRLTVLINQLLDFRKMDSTQYVINPERIDLKTHISELYERFKKTAQSKKIDFELILPSNIQTVILSDSDALTKIIGNLLTNALKFTTNKITLKLDSNADDSYTVTVEDNGRGIPNDLKTLIFDPFYQIQSHEENIGTGIGLSLVKHLVDVLNGSIEVVDSSTGGSIFIFSFTDIPDKTASTTTNSSYEHSEFTDYETKTDNKRNILVVDDNLEMIQFIKNCLQHEYSVDTSITAMDALKRLDNKSYDLIVSDIMMPEIDGISFTRKMKNDLNYSHIPIILLSAKTENSVKIDGLRSGADVFIEKPFSTSFLKAQIASLLENRKAILDTFNRSPLAPYSILTTNKSDEDFLNKLNNEIEKHLSDIDFSIESLTGILSISRSNLQRKLKSVCDVTPGDYLRTYRLKRSCALLLETDMRINEVALEVGFNSASYFTKCFVKKYGVLPKDFTRKDKTSLN